MAKYNWPHKCIFDWPCVIYQKHWWAYAYAYAKRMLNNIWMDTFGLIHEIYMINSYGQECFIQKSHYISKKIRSSWVNHPFDALKFRLRLPFSLFLPLPSPLIFLPLLPLQPPKLFFQWNPALNFKVRHDLGNFLRSSFCGNTILSLAFIRPYYFLK